MHLPPLAGMPRRNGTALFYPLLRIFAAELHIINSIWLAVTTGNF